MALMKTSPIIEAIHGSLGTVTFALTRHGQQARTRRRHPPPPSADQRTITLAMRTLRAKWYRLADEQRSAWTTFAANVPHHDAFGLIRNLTPQQCFIRYNFERFLVIGRFYTLPKFYTQNVFFSSLDITASAPATLDITPMPLEPFGWIDHIVHIARPLTTRPINHFPRWHRLGWFRTNGAKVIEAGPAFVAKFGNLRTGERIGARAKPFDHNIPYFFMVNGATFVA